MVLRAMRIAVHGAGADGDKTAPRPAPMEQDTDVFKQKILLLRNQTWTTQPSSTVLTDCWVKRMLFFFKNANTSDIINIDQVVSGT